MEFGKRLTEIRKSRKMSKYKLSELSDVSKSYLDELEKGMHSPTIQVVTQLLAPLNCSLPEFFNEEASLAYLTPKEKEHLEAYRSLSDSQQAVVDQVMDTLIPARTNPSS